MRKVPLKFLGKEYVGKPLDAEIKDYLERHGPPLDYKNELVMILEAIPDGGNAIEVRKRRKLADKIDEAADYALLEDADFSVLKAIVEKAQFRNASRNVMTFLDDVLEAEPVQVEEKAGRGGK